MKPQTVVWCLTFFYLAFWALRASNGPSNTSIAVQGFSFHRPPRITREYQSRSHRPLFSLQKPTVTNPLTGKQIVIGKGTYSNLVKSRQICTTQWHLSRIGSQFVVSFSTTRRQWRRTNGKSTTDKSLLPTICSYRFCHYHG